MRILTALALSFALFGCANETLDPDDKEFFYTGWWNPEGGAKKRMSEDYPVRAAEGRL